MDWKSFSCFRLNFSFCSCLKAAVTKYHKLGDDWEQQKCIVSQFWKPKLKVSAGLVSSQGSERSWWLLLSGFQQSWLFLACRFIAPALHSHMMFLCVSVRPDVPIYKMPVGTFLVVQSLRCRTSTDGGTGLIRGRGTKIPYAAQCGQKNKKRHQSYPIMTAF